LRVIGAPFSGSWRAWQPDFKGAKMPEQGPIGPAYSARLGIGGGAA